MFKKILSLVLTLTMVLTLGAGLMSCSDEPEDSDNGNTETPGGNENEGGNNGGSTGDGKETYTVTVKDAEGNAIAGAKVAKVDSDGNVYEDDEYLVTTDAEGRAEFALKGEGWKATVVYLPRNRGYIETSTHFAFTDKAVTITISLLPKYTIRVLDQNDDAVVGAVVQMCIVTDENNLGSCVSFRQPTDASGESIARAKADAYKANFTTTPPEGYTYDGGYVAFTSDGNGGYIATLRVTKN